MALLDLSGIRHAVDARLGDFLAGKAHIAAERQLPGEVVQVLRDFLFAGGKRLRPLLCACGWYAANGRGDTAPMLTTAAALEMFHAFALIHDDVMDRSETRRGRPTVHRTLATRYRAGRSPSVAERLGVSTAVLIGDLALSWSQELLHAAGLSPTQLSEVLAVIDTMRTEVMYGQYLDVISAGCLTGDLAQALTILRYKSATYTIEHPLHLGAVIAGADTAVRTALRAYALPLGEAFQLRDDLLGVFGTPTQTGKPVLDDLREGKNTALIALAMNNADPVQQGTLRQLVGNSELDEQGAVHVRDILTATGARCAVENMIDDRRQQALAALHTAPFPSPALVCLRDFAETVTRRVS